MSTKTESTEEIKKDNSGQSSLMDWIGSFGAEDIGVDIGTSNQGRRNGRKGSP